MSNVTKIRLVMHADAADLDKIKQAIGIDGSAAVYEEVSLAGTGEDDDSRISSAGVEMQVTGFLAIVGCHDWGVHGYTFCRIVTRMLEIAPSLCVVRLEQFDSLLDYYEVDIWTKDQPSWYQSRVAQAEFANGLLMGVHYVVEQKYQGLLDDISEIELDLQREALRHAYAQAAERGWFGFIVERAPLHG